MLSLLSAFFVSTIALVGLFTLTIKQKAIENMSYILVAVAAGTFLGDAFFHLLPESIELTEGIELKNLFIFPLIGILAFFLLEEIIHWHHHITKTSESDKKAKSYLHPIAITNLIGDGFHNFLDGVAIAASFSVSTELGFTTVIAIILHEIPQEFADFGILTYSGMKRSKALLWNFISGLLSIIGVLFFFIFKSQFENIEGYVLAFIAGVFIYIATTDLFPEIHKNKKIDYMQIIYVVVGVLIMYSLTVLE